MHSTFVCSLLKLIEIVVLEVLSVSLLEATEAVLNGALGLGSRFPNCQSEDVVEAWED